MKIANAYTLPTYLRSVNLKMRLNRSKIHESVESGTTEISCVVFDDS